MKKAASNKTAPRKATPAKATPARRPTSAKPRRAAPSKSPAALTRERAPSPAVVRPAARTTATPIERDASQIFCVYCGTSFNTVMSCCPECGHPVGAPAAAPDQSRLMRWLLPVGRSPLAIAAGYAGLFAIIIPFAPIALVLGILAIRDVRRNKRHGMGRAIFGVVTGAIGTILLALMLVAIPLGGPSDSGGATGEPPGSVIDRYVAHEAGVTAGKEHGFSAVFPDAPIKDMQKGVAGQSVDTHIYSSTVDEIAFQVAFSDAEFALDSSLPNLILRDAADEGAAIVGGKVTGYRRFTVNGDPAAAFVITVPDGTFSRARFILHGSRLYFVGVASDSPNPRGFGRFVDSFRVL